ncbi:hypothetical protein NOCA2220171 [metagenome]|uniref:Uncharacterized protein n=1 Tax=metagenome TaxID=256318 RepID=A0A2P2BYZ1_9ZZZZ
MASDARGELTVIALGLVLWVGGAFTSGEMQRALTGGGMVYTAIGAALLVVALFRRRWRDRAHGG